MLVRNTAPIEENVQASQAWLATDSFFTSRILAVYVQGLLFWIKTCKILKDRPDMIITYNYV